MVKKNWAKKGGHKFVVASATVAALAMPLAFASPSVAIARAESTVQAVQGDVKGATVPSLNDFNTAKANYEKTLTDYESALNNLKALEKDQSLTKDTAYKDLVAKQEAELAPLVQDVDTLRNDLVAINEMANKISTTNQDTLNASVAELNKLAATATTAEQNMKNTEQTLATNRTATQQKIAELQAKLADAKKAYEAKSTEFETFKKTYNQKAAEYNSLKPKYDAELAKINSQIDELKQQISALPKDSDKGYDAANEKAAQIQKQIDALKTQYSEVEAKYNDIDASYKELQGKYDALEKDYQNAQSIVEAANNDINAFNKQVEADNTTLEASYNTAKKAYDEAVAKRKDLETTIAQQKQQAQAENAKNQQVYNQAKTKLDALTAKMTEFNQARKDTIGQIQDTKTKFDDAYKAAEAALTKLNDAMQTAKQALDTYNAGVDAYNAEEQKTYDAALAKYNADVQAYNTAMAEYNQKLQQMEQNKDKPGNLSQPQGQALDWGKKTDITAEEALKDGYIKWEKGNPQIIFDDIPAVNRNGIAVNLNPGESNTVVYSGKAISGMHFGDTPITSVRITYHNPNIYPIDVLAEANLHDGFKQGWIRDGKMYPNPGDKGPQNIPYEETLLVKTDVTIQFMHDDQPISFSDEKPAVLFMSSLNYHADFQIEGVMDWNFDKIIPITDSMIVEETSIPGTKPIPQINANNPILAGKGWTDPAWDSPTSPNWYKLTIAGAKTSGNQIKFAATVAEPGGRVPSLLSGIWFAFYSDTPLAHIPTVPTPPKKPELKKIDNETYNFNTPKAAVNPNIVVPNIDELTPPAAMPAVVEIKEGNVQVPNNPTEPNKPVPGQALNLNDSLPELVKFDVVAPEVPAAVPEVPNVPPTPPVVPPTTPPVVPPTTPPATPPTQQTPPQKKRLPKTADDAIALLTGALATAGAAAAIAGSRKTKRSHNEEN